MLAVTIADCLAYRHLAELAAESCQRYLGLRTEILTPEPGYPAAYTKLQLLRRFPDQTILYYDADVRFIATWPDLPSYSDQVAVIASQDLPSQARATDCRRYQLNAALWIASGLWIANGRHAPVWDLAWTIATHRDYKTAFRYEMAALNAAIQRTATPVRFLAPHEHWICSPEHLPPRNVICMHIAGGTIQGRNRAVFERALRDRARNEPFPPVSNFKSEIRNSKPVPVDIHNAAALSRSWLSAELGCHPYPAERYSGRGIVIAAGGPKYGTCGYVAIRALRAAGCTLPIEVWYRGIGEYSPALEDLTTPFGCRWIDAYAVRERYPHARLNGFELKPYAIMHSSFAEVLFVDADNVVCTDPTYLFNSPQFEQCGTLLWPDYGRLDKSRAAWELFGVPYRDEWECESGQVLIDKRRAWPALLLADWYGQRSELTFRHVHGDKELFHLCWRALDIPYAMPAKHIRTLRTKDGRHSTMCQHDYAGKRVFQHRNGTKFEYAEAANHRIPGFLLEDECFIWLRQLRSKYSPAAATIATAGDEQQISALAGRKYDYERIKHGKPRILALAADGTFSRGGAACERYWTVRDGRLLIAGEDGLLTMDLRCDDAGRWHGRWLHHERMPVKLTPIQ